MILSLLYLRIHPFFRVMISWACEKVGLILEMQFPWVGPKWDFDVIFDPKNNGAILVSLFFYSWVECDFYSLDSYESFSKGKNSDLADLWAFFGN